jgi:hypothetical protein
MSMKYSRSMFGEYYVPCTLNTESEIKSSPGFRIDIISGKWSEWMLPFFFTPNELFSQLCHMARAIFISISWYMDFNSVSPLKQQSLVWHNRNSNPWYTTPETSRLTNYLTTDLAQAYRTWHATSNSSLNGTLFSSFCNKLNSLMYESYYSFALFCGL